MDRLQNARHGDALLDALVDDGLHALAPRLRAHGLGRLPASGAARWSDDLAAPISLLTMAYNFSVGQRDGVRWAWIQPNDDWRPKPFEARHDHPRGSGLIVAYTAPLALTAAALILCTRPAPPML